MSSLASKRLLPCLLVCLATLVGPRASGAAPVTDRIYLSGHGPRDAVSWDFMVTGGMRAGEHATIPVPSNWELQGFGAYNYGQDPAPKANEHGLYRRRFSVPAAWAGKKLSIVFEGVMTDATVLVNGHSAGPTHQGAFYRFSYDITSLVKIGSDDNLLEVDVSKVSANPETESAERGGDYWVFGGIFRPVWLEASPAQSIAGVAIDARADGTLSAEVTLSSVRDATGVRAQVVDPDGKGFGSEALVRIPSGGAGRVPLHMTFPSPRLWTAETPALYTLRLVLMKGTEELHSTSARFGFRTFEVRPGKGYFLNGQRIVLKGVDRHSFRPETGRTLSPEDCYDDVRLIKEMNMNAARMSHYPPDEAFLNACDELGLYVLDEFSGWHHSHDTDIGRVLIRAMVERDVDHPSILFWDNGNEGGWNRELDGEFALYDPQKRHVLHPWELHDDVNTKHYPNYEDFCALLRGPNIVMPTEFLHAIYDGGAGAGLEDYWKAITSSPVGGGGFIWMMADEGVVRTDQGGRIDVFGTYDPDGIVGPHHEKEGSFYTIRDIYSPVQVGTPSLKDGFSGELAVENHFDFTSLSQCRFAWKLIRFPKPNETGTDPVVGAEGEAFSPDVGPHGEGTLHLNLPKDEAGADALMLTVTGPFGEKLWTWTWPMAGLRNRLDTNGGGQGAVLASRSGKEIILRSKEVEARFDADLGVLVGLSRGEAHYALSSGPRLVYAHPEGTRPIDWTVPGEIAPKDGTYRFGEGRLANTLEIDLEYSRLVAYATFRLEISPDGQVWRTLYEGARRDKDGKRYNFPPQRVKAVRISHIRRSDGQPIALKSVRLGYSIDRFPSVDNAQAKVTTGVGADGRSSWVEAARSQGLDTFRWTLEGDGTLRLDYTYSLAGDFLYHGITFDLPETQMRGVRWLGDGPYRVWKNRLRGAVLGVHQISRNDIQAGESWTYPEFQGFFAEPYWARIDTQSGPLVVTIKAGGSYLRIGTPRINHQNTSAEFPQGDVSFLEAIPAMGSKFIHPENSGPSGQPTSSHGTFSGSLIFQGGTP